MFGLVTECSGFPLARGSSLYRTSGAVGACRDLSRLPDILWGGVSLLCRCLVVFGGGGVWCSLCQLCTATGLSVKILRIRLHQAAQGVLFEGEAVEGTCKEGVVGWGCSRCRSQRLKLAKFLFGRNLRKSVRDYLNNQPIASLQNRRGDREYVPEAVAEVLRRID